MLSSTDGSASFILFKIFFFCFLILVKCISCSSAHTLCNGISDDSVTLIRTLAETAHLHFYFQDIVGGENATAKRIINGTDEQYGFGTTFIIDDALTEGPELTSKIIGRAQGMYTVAAQNDFALLMVVNYGFTDGKYNNSSISVLGRNHVLDDVREMPVVGGTGVFRFARGYALAHTVELKDEFAIVEYDVYVQI